ncbi:MAG: hypothetical protein QG580_418 [Patescibacteria group bacterium]|jgi:hypothetical protein|nr:hypothetical protein [Patescibacteria group bacterium]
MSISNDQKNILKQTYEDSSRVVSDFRNFNLTTRVNLINNQLNFFTVLSTINIAILLSLFEVINIFSIISVLFSVFLVISSVSIIRFKFDEQSKNLDDADKQIIETHISIENKIQETLDSGDYSVFKNFCIQKVKNYSEPHKIKSYLGDFFTSVFIFSFIMSMFAILWPECLIILKILLALLLSYFLGFRDFYQKFLNKILIKKVINNS